MADPPDSRARNQIPWRLCRRLSTIYALLVAMAWNAGGSQRSGEEPGFDLAAVHADRLAWQQTSWTSIELRVREVLRRPSNWGAGRQAFDTIVGYYVETAGGRRLLDSQCSMDGEEKLRNTSTFNGKRGAQIAYRRDDLTKQQQVILQRHFGKEDLGAHTDRPCPLFYYWVGREPLHEVLRHAQAIGQRRVAGRDCDVFHLSDRGPAGPRELVYCLDKVTSVPLGFEWYRNTADRAGGQPVVVWTAETIDEVQGYPVVRLSMREDYTGEGAAHSMSRRYEVESIAFNKEFPESCFSPEIQPEAVVFDTITNQPIYPTGEARDVSKDATPTPLAMHEPGIRATLPRPWAGYAAPASIGLGLLLLTTSLLLLWRRR